MLLLRLTVAAMAVLSYVSPRLSAPFFRRLMLRPRRGAIPAAASLPIADERLEVCPGLVAWRWGDGPRVLLAHGWEGHHRNFAALIEALLARGFGVVALDMPAHGASAGRESNVVMFADAIATALDRLGPVHAVVGHSMGGAMALRAVAGRTDVGRAIAIAAPMSLVRVLRRFGVALGLSRRGTDAFLHAVERRVGVPARDLDIRQSASRLDLPILLIHDRHDREVPVFESGRAAHLLRHARLMVTENLGHRRLLRDGEVIAACVDFIAAGTNAPRLAA